MSALPRAYLLCDMGYRAHLICSQEPVRNANAHHEIGDRLAFSAGATYRSDAVTLRVHAP